MRERSGRCAHKERTKEQKKNNRQRERERGLKVKGPKKTEEEQALMRRKKLTPEWGKGVRFSHELSRYVSSRESKKKQMKIERMGERGREEERGKGSTITPID